MNHSHFDECIDILTTPIEHLSPMHPQQSPLLESTARIAGFFVEPFTLELENQIISKNTSEQKADLIKFYVSRLMKSKNHKSINDIQPGSDANIQSKDKNEISPVKTSIKGMIIMDVPNTPGHYLKFKQGCNILYHLLLEELQKYCSIYDISFNDICMKLGFAMDTIKIQVPSQNKKKLFEQISDVQKGACEKLKQALLENGFFNLPKVMELKEQSQEELIKLICSNEVPYKIAMFDFLGFIDYFLTEYASTRTEMYRHFAEIFCGVNKPVSKRTVQGNINDLLKKPENRDPRYTASMHKEIVKNHHNTLK